jgi:RNA polymerase sigma-70 factor (ECF subfamily)
MRSKILKFVHGGSAATLKSDGGSAPPAQLELEQKRQFIDHLFRRYRQSLQNYLNKLTGNRDESEEVIQETYLRLIQTDKLDRLEAKARNYIFAIATNLVRDRRRYDRVRAKDKHISIDEVELLCESSMPEQLVDRDEQLEIVKQSLLELQPRCQRAFVLHAVEQLTFREIAQILNVSSKTVERDFGLALDLCLLRLRDRAR